MDAPILGVILAGGRAQRMGGGDKPLLMLSGRRLLDHVSERLVPQCAAGIILSANGHPARFAPFAGPILADGVPGHAGPLAGILAALDFAAGLDPSLTHVASVPGDAPFLPRDVVAKLLGALRSSDAPIAHAASGGHRHYASALWPVALRRDVRAALRQGERGVGAFITRHGAATVEWPTDPVDPFLNINTPDDLAEAERLTSTHPLA